MAVKYTIYKYLRRDYDLGDTGDRVNYAFEARDSSVYVGPESAITGSADKAEPHGVVTAPDGSELIRDDLGDLCLQINGGHLYTAYDAVYGAVASECGHGYGYRTPKKMS